MRTTFQDTGRFNEMIDSKGGFKRFDFKEPFQNPKETLQNFLKGKGHITTHCNIPTQKQSSYMTTYKGLPAQASRGPDGILELDQSVGD